MRTIRDVFIRPQKAALQVVPQGSTGIGVRSLTNDQGLIPLSSGAELKRIGRALFRLLVRKADPRLLTRTRGAADGRRTRFWVLLDQPKKDAQPWELLCHPDNRGAFLAYDRTTPIVRALERPESAHRLPPIEGPVRILGVIANPQDPQLRPLNVETEKKNLEKLLSSNIKLGLVKLKWIEGAGTARKIHSALQQPWHVVHYIGHGDFDAASDQGVLILEDDAGGASAMAASVLGATLAGLAVRLVVLNSCRGAFAGQGGLLTSSAAQLALRVPAVVAMQTAISDPAGVVFCERFYESLLNGRPVEVAVTDARLALASLPASHPAIEWPAPVLYLSTKHDVFNLQTLKAQPQAVRSRRQRQPRHAGATLEGVVLLPAAKGKKKKAPDDDPRKYQWGGEPSRHGRTLSAKVKMVDEDWYRIQLTVTTDPGAAKLTGPVHFHLHDSFPEPVRTVTASDGVARLSLYAYGAFTVGASADGGKTHVELDLADLRGAPKDFRES